VDIVIDAWRDDSDKQESIRASFEKTLSEIACARSLKLERLEGITITDRLDQALAAFDDGGLDRGRTLMRTTGEVEGVAMTPVGVRHGKAYCRIFLQSSTVEDIYGRPSSVIARYVVVHELAHAHDLTVKSASIEAILVKTPRDLFTPPVFWQIAEIVWNEYAASRLSATENPDMQQTMDQMLVMALRQIKPGTKRIIQTCQQAGRSATAFELATPLVSNVLKHTSHVIGHEEGNRRPNRTLEPALGQSLQAAQWESGFSEQRSILNEMWASYGNWKDISVFAPLLSFIKRSYRVCAVEVYTQDSQAKARLFMHLLPQFINS
jgi:hypothetical protein